MAEICVVYLSEDEAIVERLVALLRKHWDVWWARDIAHGDWEEAVRAEIPKCSALLPVLSRHAKGARKNILKDEMRFAQKQKKPILPFLIGPADVPFGFGDLSYTAAHDWSGEEGVQGYKQLKAKIATTIGSGRLERMRELTVRGKTLRLPAFAFSLSSHDTQVTPQEGATLLRLLQPNAVLVSAYDASKGKKRHTASLRSSLKQLCKSDTVLFLDSGNYEAYRKNDRYHPKKNSNGWHRNHFLEMAARISPDLVFSFDTIGPTGKPDGIAARIVANFGADDRALRKRNFPLCPIIHLPPKYEEPLGGCAARIISKVAADLDPLMLAIPERELGDGLVKRVRTVHDIRRALNALGKYYPLHLLGTGNPISMIALSAAGADAFDGLEWCRTVADYSTGRLFHFQQFECFNQVYLGQLRDQKIRRIIENPQATYAMKTLSYNVDFFEDWTRTMQNMIHSGQVETLLRSVPSIGPTLFKAISI